MDLVGFYYRRLVTFSDMLLFQSNAEDADLELYTDHSPPGVASGLVAAENSPVAMNITVTAGTARNQTGQRMRVPSTQVVDLSVDNASATTAVTTVGNSKIISVFLRFARNEYDPQIDGNSVTQKFRKDEFFEWFVVQSAEDVSPVAPTLLADGILICDVTRVWGQTTIANGDISTTRRQDAYVVAGTPQSLRRGKSLDALSDLLGWYNAHVTGVADQHAAGSVSVAIAETWKDTTGISATDLDGALEEILADLKGVAAGASGAHKLGAAEITGATVTVPAGSIQAALVALQQAVKIDLTVGPNWADNSANAATNAEAFVHAMITGLSSKTGAVGAYKIGLNATGGINNGVASNLQTVGHAFQELVGVGVGDDGAKRIGAEAVGGLVGATVRAQLTEMGPGTAEIFTAQKTFGGGLWPGLNSRSVTREHSLDVYLESNANDTALSISDLTATVHGVSYESPNVITTVTSATDHWHTTELDRPLDGNTLTSVSIDTKLTAADWGLQVKPTFDVVRWKVGTGGLTMESLISGSLPVDDHVVGTNGTIRVQTITCDQNNVIDLTQYRYAVRVTHPYLGDGQLRIYGIRSVYSAATTLRHG